MSLPLVLILIGFGNLSQVLGYLSTDGSNSLDSWHGPSWINNVFHNESNKTDRSDKQFEPVALIFPKVRSRIMPGIMSDIKLENLQGESNRPQQRFIDLFGSDNTNDEEDIEETGSATTTEASFVSSIIDGLGRDDSKEDDDEDEDEDDEDDEDDDENDYEDNGDNSKYDKKNAKKGNMAIKNRKKPSKFSKYEKELKQIRRRYVRTHKYIFPLLLAYKLKFFTMVPLLLGKLILLVSATGVAGFFFALFAAAMGISKKH